MKVLQEAHKSRGVVLRLAVADLGHEWILTLCLVMATAAVIAPLLTLMGLKYGTIATLRDRLVQDPVYREIRPAATRVRRQAWFQEYQTRREVAFLIPTILPASSIIQALPSKRPRSHAMDLIPTAAGDPLILENGGTIPGPGQCVLTTTAAQRLEVKEGDVLETRATRIRDGRREFGKAMLEVVSVLRPSAGGLERMYAPLSFVLDVDG